MDVVIFICIMTIPKSLSPDAFARLRICQKCVCGRGSAPDPAGGAYSAPQRPLAGFGGAASRRGEEWEGRYGNERGEKEGGEGRAKERKGP